MGIGFQCSDMMYGVGCDVISSVTAFMVIGFQCSDMMYGVGCDVISVVAEFMVTDTACRIPTHCMVAPVRKVNTREACHRSHAWPGFTPTNINIVNPNRLLEQTLAASLCHGRV
jgi:hypothetical protein